MEFDKRVNELKVGMMLDSFFLIKSVDVKTTTSNSKFMDFALADRTGEINGKLWSCSEADVANFTASQLVKIRGEVAEWQGKMQLKIDKMRLASESDDKHIEDFVPSAPDSSEEMYAVLMNYVEKIRDYDVKNIVLYILEEAEGKIMHYPAAMKNHHSVRGGLLYHITTMLKAGEKLSEVYTFLNTDILFGGIILHDIAKIHEMDASDLGIVSDYTTEGQLLGHIIQGIKMVEIASEAVGASKETSMMLQHMILTHHYEPEYGSPKKPMTPEGEILHHLDEMDAVMFDMKKALQDTQSGEFSEKVWTLQRKVYKSEKAFEE